MKNHEEVLVALRRIIRAVDIHSRKLMKVSGFTGPQLIVIQSIQELGNVTIGSIARHVNLSQATVTSILDRLVKRNLVVRSRNETDKRVVHAQLTPEGQAALKQSPTLLQDEFIQRFQELKNWEQSQILSSLQRLAEMMDAQNIDAAPMLEIAPLPSNKPEEFTSPDSDLVPKEKNLNEPNSSD
ncbi:MAG: MarR family transcriptional regulator [SAR324 cluster bacterium]|nr:MarR family transcriptional regulator [SAR324 cluster bacterium]